MSHFFSNDGLDAQLKQIANFTLDSEGGNEGYFLKNNAGTFELATVTGTSTTINSNADTLLITGSGTPNTLNAQSTLKFSSNTLTLEADSSILAMGADSDVKLTHVADTGILLNDTKQLQFGDSGTYIHQSADGVLDLVSDTTIEINATTIDMNGAVDISGNITAGGTITATGNVIPATANGAALGSSSKEWSDLFLADGSVINLGADQDVTLTHVADTGILLNSSKQLQFGDSGTYIHQSADGVLDLVSDTEIEINATTIDINGAVDISGNTTLGGKLITTPQELTVGNDGNINSGTAITPTKSIINFTAHGSGTVNGSYSCSLSSYSATEGEVIHLFYDNSSATELQIDFGSGNLLSATGTNQYLTFQTQGQSATIIYVNSKWRIINTGAAVSS